MSHNNKSYKQTNRISPFYIIPIVNPLDKPQKKNIKRAFDLLLSSLSLLLFPVILTPVAIAIKITSPGPVFYRQIRSGKNGKLFTCYKFRTMYKNSSDEPVKRNDPRVTPIGKLLRKTSIDELPQIINVFLGHMSIVGPRPHMIAHTIFYQTIIDHYNERMTVKPGITGWAQINGFRGTTDKLWKMRKRVDHDRWYISNWTLTLDIKIIINTIVKLVKGDENAY